MPNWFYYNELGTRTGPVTAERLKLLVNAGTIKPGTIVEMESGQQGYAKNVKGLFQASEPATKRMEMPSSPPPPVSSVGNALPVVGNRGPNVNQRWFFYENDGTKVGPLSAEELKFFMDTGAITLGTILESETGFQTMARNVRELLQRLEPATKRMETPVPPPPQAVSVPLENKPLPVSAPPAPHPAKERTSGLWFYYDTANQKVGPFDFPTLKTLAHHGIIHPETVVESETGTPRMEAHYFAGADKLFFSPSDSDFPPTPPDFSTSAKKPSPEPEPKVIYVERPPEKPPVDMGCGCVGCLVFILLFFLMALAGACTI